MSGEINEVSAAIGELKGTVQALVSAVGKSEESRKDIYKDINSLKSSFNQLSSALILIKETIDKMSKTLESHEAFRQRATGGLYAISGVKAIVISILGSGGLIALYDTVKSWKWH